MLLNSMRQKFVLLEIVAACAVLVKDMLGRLRAQLEGELADIYWRRPFVLLGIALFSTGSIVCGLSTSMIL